jgi:hypothetical protein
MQKAIVLRPTPWVAIILKMFMFSQGLGVPTCHPIKGGTQQNVLEWMGLGFNFGLWWPIKRMLQEEGFLLLRVQRTYLHARNGSDM